jgi:hypothetical protein
MIARHEAHMDKMDIWSKLSAPLPPGVISWRQDGKPVQRDGKYVARFVAYIDANTVRERLDSVVPGEWDLTLELLPTLAGQDENGEQSCSFKARLQILGVIREDVGTGRDYKSAATDAFKRAAVRFGIAHELYSFEQNWVQVDSDGRYAKPLEDPAAVYARRQARAEARERARTERDDEAVLNEVHVETTVAGPANGPLALDEPSCPKCGGRMWDNRLSKRNPKAPDYKCRNRSCDGVIWPAKTGSRSSANGRGATESADPLVEEAEALAPEADQIPF